MTLQNGSGTHFGASQCISMDLAADAPAAAAADARCGYSLRRIFLIERKTRNVTCMINVNKF